MKGSSFALAGVMGWPIAHSRSPMLHGHWLERLGVRGAYVPLSVRPERLERALRALPDLGFAGCNLTVPHKVMALEFLDHVDPLVGRVGAANTVVVREDGSLSGLNTDVFGFSAHLRAEIGVVEGPAVVLGAGGGARAVVCALRDLGVGDIVVVNRDFARAARLCDDLGGTPRDWSYLPKSLSDAKVLVNATSLGMTGQPSLDIDLSGLSGEAVVVDIVYAPLETPLLAAARARGLRAVDGLGMLIHQARPAFAAWFGVMPEADGELRRRLAEDIARR